MTDTLAVLGAGSWGTALAIALARRGHAVRLWTRSAADAAAMNALRVNARYLPDLVLPTGVTATAALDAAVAGADGVLVAVPSSAFRELLRQLAPLADWRQLAWASKGFERDSGNLLHEVLAEELGPQVEGVVISGPSFAAEVALNLPTALVVAARQAADADAWVRRLHGDALRAYRSDDPIGVQVGGAVKNVLAIAAGMADGAGFGANARAALVTRGLVEVQRLGVALGAQPQTLLGLGGLGDLLLTCTDDQSRNRRLGLALAAGKTLQQASEALGQVAEGAVTVRAVQRLAQRFTVQMPICAAVYSVLYEGCAARDAMQALLARAPTDEF
ncbi:MAG TPA: glycerol-3-phosphate dehydrogenase [Gammaproteobacteria bacterium]|uniref:NAD(P)H-dependent glycerol-3-phosphate dehydrogenase n=1 Tax=Immundisolibacter sp. TaxID=1934948 RepID=UPI000E97727C|nr:glycerol-3-phosphate dehydrogenase [Gammaproteobacteria bacterium]HCZ48564.1 glycerol-3-phosphate dehydrogenase [Gammaproteobacteria bacterium]MCH78002.1 glycerol-3-phosphate dehydrogenase [Gammaproteobacteria bacterium]